MQLRVQLSYPDGSSHVCSFAYNFPIRITSSSCAASLTTFLPELLDPLVQLCLLLSYPDYSVVCCIAIATAIAYRRHLLGMKTGGLENYFKMLNIHPDDLFTWDNISKLLKARFMLTVSYPYPLVVALIWGSWAGLHRPAYPPPTYTPRAAGLHNFIHGCSDSNGFMPIHGIYFSMLNLQLKMRVFLLTPTCIYIGVFIARTNDKNVGFF